MSTEVAIPILPCHSINEVLDFYRALGFEVTYQQKVPNNYAVVKLRSIELHFFSMRDYVPANSYSTCYILVSDVDALYAAFRAALREKYGKIPVSGIPRLIALKDKSYGVREFIVVDPGGNWLRIGQKIEAALDEKDNQLQTEDDSKLNKAVEAAVALGDSKGDYEAAAKTLDIAFAKSEAVTASTRVKALVARANIAVALGNIPHAAQLLQQVRNTPLGAAERKALQIELERASDLEATLN